MNRGAVAEIDLEAIAHNFRTARKIARNKQVIAVVKADAYGHGAAESAVKLIKEGASCLAVAYISEAVVLRHAGIKVPIIVLFDKEDIHDYFRYNLIPVIYDAKTAHKFLKETLRLKRKISIHLKVDTGMGRLGFNCRDIEKGINTIAKMDSITIAGLMSHFSDADLCDRSDAVAQIARFNLIKNGLIKKGIKPIMCHMSNSAAVLSLPEAHLDAVRPGLMLYGYSPMQDAGYRMQDTRYHESCIMNHALSLKPAMTVKTKILSLRRLKKGTSISYGRIFITGRESIIAVLPVGYADGYSRSFSNNSDVLIRGNRAPVVGRVCMDTTMADVTDVEGVAEGDEVVMLGRQKKNIITASELALRAGTITYEILTSFGSKARRKYLHP